MSNYETFDMNMSVYPAQWAKALANVSDPLTSIEVPGKDVEIGWIIDVNGYRMRVEYVAASEHFNSVTIAGKLVASEQQRFSYKNIGCPHSATLFYGQTVEHVVQEGSELEPSIETLQEAVVRVLRQTADALEGRDGWHPGDLPIFINGERVGHASFGNV
jgi:hypothetical protein